MLNVLAKVKEIGVQKIAVSVIAVICAFILIIQTTSAAYASEGSATITDELNGMTIDGKAFDISDYPADAEGVPQLINLYEGGYCYYTNKQEHYGLLLYIYNPAQIEVKDDARNAVQMKTGNAERSEKYKLKLLETSEDKLFCKFLVDFTDEEKAGVLATLDREERRYDVNTVELYESGANATSYPIERFYIYKGYEAGYGADGESTIAGGLSYTEEGGTETKRIAVKHTTWRPEGTNGNSEYTQDSIHSVYFAIPNEVAEQYDYLNSVKVEYWEAYTKPIFVTGNSEIYNAVSELVLNQLKKEVIDDGNIGTGADGPSAVIVPEKFDFSGFSYAIAGGVTQNSNLVGNMISYDCEMVLNRLYSLPNKLTPIGAFKTELQSLYWYYLVEGNAGEQPISPHKLADYALNNAPYYNDKKVAGKYPSYLFESYATEKYIDVIPVGREYELTSEKVVQGFWEKVFGTSHVENKKDFEAVAIQEVESLTGNKTTDCANYYVGENDYSEFKAFYAANKKNSTVYLLRFATSDYTSMQVYTFGETKDFLGWTTIDVVDTNSYFAQTKVYLDFDVIDLEYIKDDKSYIIPVDMSPIDIFPELTPPVYWDEAVSDFWKYGCGIIGGLIAVWAVYGVAEKALRR